MWLADAGTAAQAPVGIIGPSYQLTGNGHQLEPAGTLTSVGDFPDGSAVQPGNRFLWVVDCGHGIDDAKILSLATHKVIQTLPLPGCYGGVAFAKGGARAYISGEPLAGNPTDGTTVGNEGDVVHVFSVNPTTGQATENGPIALMSTSGGSARTNSLPPVSGQGTEYPEGLAVSPDGRYLVVALNGADRAIVINLQTQAQTAVSVGAYPESVVFDPQGHAYVSNEYDGTVSVIDPATAKVTATISGLGGAKGDLGSHVEGMVADPRRTALYVAVTGRDLVDVVDTTTDQVTHEISVARPQGLGTEPVNLSLSPADTTLYAADAGDDSIAAVSLTQRPGPIALKKVYERPYTTAIYRYLKQKPAKRNAKLIAPRGTLQACSGPTRVQVTAYVKRAEAVIRAGGKQERAKLNRVVDAVPVIHRCHQTWVSNLAPYTLIGRIPTAAYPDSVQTTPTGQLIYIAGKGFGSGPNPTYYFGGSPLAPGVTPTNQYGTYVLDKLIGDVGFVGLPTDLQVVGDTTQANAQSVPDNTETQPANSPVPASFGHPSSQIKHVFYIVRENRTYDQVFGSDPRGDGDKALELFDDNGVAGPTGGITPNAHSLVSRFPLLDHFYEDSEVSVDGHLITAGAEATDYVQKSTAANYSGRRPTDDLGIYPVSFPPNFFIFDQASQQGISYEDFGEAVGAEPMGGASNRKEGANVLTHVDEPYPNNIFIGCARAGVTASCTQDSGLYKGTGTLFGGQSRFTQWDTLFQTELATNSVPTLNYMILPSDHTNGTTAGDPTPQAFVADNDLGLGQIVDAISHSSIWSSSAIFVVEDDSQDGADHIDSHRAPALVISPWANQGAVIHTRYDQYSVLKTIELITGLQPLELTDALATPMYDTFISGGQQPNDAPYNVIEPTYPLTTKNTASSANAKLSGELPWNRMDQVPQAISDQILWQAVHGKNSTPPPAGPNASPDEVQRAQAMRSLIAAQTARPKSRQRASAKASGSCPISWACYQAPTGAAG